MKHTHTQYKGENLSSDIFIKIKINRILIPSLFTKIYDIKSWKVAINNFPWQFSCMTNCKKNQFQVFDLQPSLW